MPFDAAAPTWYDVFRDGIAPFLPTSGLRFLRAALVADDSRLAQGCTTTPPPLQVVQDWPVEAACAIGFCGWHGDDLQTVGEVEAFFARVCYECDLRLGRAVCRYWLDYWDDTPRAELFRDVLVEVDAVLAGRESGDVREGDTA